MWKTVLFKGALAFALASSTPTDALQCATVCVSQCRPSTRFWHLCSRMGHPSPSLRASELCSSIITYSTTPKSAEVSKTTSSATKTTRPPPKPVFLTHERDFFRQVARLESMDSYVLVSTLTTSMSFGALIGFGPSMVASKTLLLRSSAKFFYNGLCLAIQAVSGLSALFGVHAMLVFSLTILYAKSALGLERDRDYDKFIRKTVRARVRGFRCFSLSLSFFASEVFLVLLERTFAVCRACTVPFGIAGVGILYFLYRDWQLLYETAEIIYQD